MAENETNTLKRRSASQPADEAVAHVAKLLAQDQAFVRALHAAIRSGSETAAGVTATVRTGRRETLSSADQHDAR